MSENDGTYVVAWNGSDEKADASTAGVADFGIYYEVRVRLRRCLASTTGASRI